jgi:hypothetical protein
MPYSRDYGNQISFHSSGCRGAHPIHRVNLPRMLLCPFRIQNAMQVSISSSLLREIKRPAKHHLGLYRRRHLCGDAMHGVSSLSRHSLAVQPLSATVSSTMAPGLLDRKRCVLYSSLKDALVMFNYSNNLFVLSKTSVFNNRKPDE